MGGCLFKLGVSAAATEFCEWAQLGIDVYILHCKYHVKPHSSPQFLVPCAVVIAHINYFFCVQQQNKSSEPKVEFRQFSNPGKRVLEAAKHTYGNKTKGAIFSQKLGLQDFGKLPILFSIKVNLCYLLYSMTQRCYLLHLIKKICFQKPFLGTLILMTQVSIYMFCILELI